MLTINEISKGETSMRFSWGGIGGVVDDVVDGVVDGVVGGVVWSMVWWMGGGGEWFDL